MAIQRRERAARAGERKGSKHYRYGVKWRLGGGTDGAPQSRMIGDKPGHHADAIKLNAWLKSEAWCVTADDPRIDALLGVQTVEPADDDDEPARTVRELVAEFAARPNLSAGTRNTYGSLLNRWLGELADLPADKVTRRHVNAWLTSMEIAGAALASRVMRARVLKGAIGAHAAADAFADMPNAPRVSRMSNPTLLSDEQIADLIKHATPGTGLALPIRVLAETGIRWGEMAGLTAGMIDLERCTIRIERQRVRGAGFATGPLKTARSRRTVRIPQDLADALALVRELPNDAPVFTSPTGEPWHYQQFRLAWLRVVAATPSVPAAKIHDLRHSAAVRMLQRSVPLGMVSRALGHSDVKITDEVYGQFTDDTTAAVIVAAGLRL